MGGEFCDCLPTRLIAKLHAPSHTVMSVFFILSTLHVRNIIYFIDILDVFPVR